jgi:hypothetical protein
MDGSFCVAEHGIALAAGTATGWRLKAPETR